MSGLIILIAVIALVAIFDVIAQTYGVDSRPGFEDTRAPAHGIYV